MALPYTVKFTVKDGAYAATKKTSSGTFYIDSAQTVANATTEAEALLQEIADLCVGQIVSATLSIPIDISGLTSNGAADSQSNIKYKFRFGMASAEGHGTELNIPAADQSESVPGSNLVDTTTALAPGTVLKASLITRPIVTSHDEPVTVVTIAEEIWG